MDQKQSVPTLRPCPIPSVGLFSWRSPPSSHLSQRAAAARAPRPASASSSSASGTGQLDKLTIGYSAWPGWFPLAVADQKGIFKQAGLDVDLKYFVDYTASLDALVANQWMSTHKR